MFAFVRRVRDFRTLGPRDFWIRGIIFDVLISGSFDLLLSGLVGLSTIVHLWEFLGLHMLNSS